MSTRQQHYSGAKHAKRVRACLEEWSKKNPGKRTLRIENGANKNTKGQQKEKQADNEQMKRSKKTRINNMKDQQIKTEKTNHKKIKGSRSHVELSARACYPPSRPL